VSVSGALSSDSLLNMVQVPFVGRVERLRLLGALSASACSARWSPPAAS